MRNFLQKIIAADERISAGLRIRDQNSLLFQLSAIFAHSGDSWLWCGALFVLWLFAEGERQRILAWWGGTIALTAVFVFFLKRVIARSRPKGEWGGVYRRSDPYSFPSGHAVRAGLIVVLAFNTFHHPLLLAGICLWAVLMTLSRVSSGVHYLLDVWAGFLLGLIIGQLWMLAQPWFFRTFAVLFDRSLWFK